MLKEFQDRLQEMARDPRDPFNSLIVKLVGAGSAAKYEGPLREMILALPKMTQQISVWSKDPHQPASVKRLHTFMLAYLYKTDNFLSARNLGFFGYLDDAFMVGRVVQLTSEASEKNGIKLKPSDGPTHTTIAGWVTLLKELLPDESGRMDRMLEEIRQDRPVSVEMSLRQASKGTPTSRRLEKAAMQ